MVRLNGRLLSGVSFLALSMAMPALVPHAAMAAACNSPTTANDPICTWSSGDLSVISGGTISGGNPAITQSGTTGILTNSGIISGTTNGLSASGSMSALTNSGSIAGNGGGNFDAAVISSGTIGTLTNSGTITGVGNGVLNNIGTIGTLVNNGRITGVGGANAAVYNRSGTITAIVNNAGATISGTNNGGLDNNNGANLGTVTNYGLITGTGYGVYNGASSTITALNNLGGTISGGTGVFVNGGAITTLTNSGTITSTGNAININAGTIGSIVNSGVISGKILNSTSNVLTINGGSGSTFGTLTGSSIVSTSANVVFGSGNILLEDNVNVTGRTLANTGAIIKLTTGTVPTITGTYNQTGGGIVVTPASTTSYGWMNVTGNATVNNSTITLSGTTMNAGERYTIVRSGGTGTYTGDTAAVAGRGGLVASVITVGGTDLVVVLAARDYGTLSGTPANLSSTLNRLAASTSAQASAFQTDVLSPLDALPTDQQAQAAKQLEPTKNAPASQMAANAATVVLGAVEQHQQTVMAYDSSVGGAGKAAGSDSHDSALWGEFLGGGASRSSNSEADGYRTRNLGVAVGIDQQFDKNAMAGVALSWIRSWSQGRDGSAGSSSTLDSYQLTFYGTYRIDQAFVDGQLAVGLNRFDQHRAIPFLGTRADASYGGQQYLAKATFGYDLPMDGVTLTPLAGLRWLRATNDGYSETGAGAANLVVNKGGTTYVSHDLGGKVSFTTPTGLGSLRSEFKLAWVHDYTQGAIPTSGLMGGETFASTTPRTKPDGARIGLAGTLNSDDDISFRAEYEGELRQQYQSHAGLVKAIWGF